MRILFVSQLVPWPLDAGPKLRAYYVLRHLAEAGHDVSLVSFVRPTDRPEDVATLERFCRRVELVPLRRSRWRDLRDGAHSLVSRLPFLILRDRVAAMDQRVASLTATTSFDAVHSDQLWMGPPVVAAATADRRVLDQHNAVFRVPEQLADGAGNPVLRALLGLEARKLGAFERETIDRFGDVVWVNDADRDALCGAGGGSATHRVIPIAIDPGTRPPLVRRDPFRVTFLGGLHWPPNAHAVRWLVDAIWPRVRAACPSAVLTVVGTGVPRWLGRRSGADGVEVTGYLPDVTPHLEETAVFVVPLRSGAGMRVKILDAWCRALPVVTTTLGAEGLALVDGENGLAADDAKSFADRVVRVLRDRRLADRLATGGRSTVEQAYDWRRLYGAWDEVYH